MSAKIFAVAALSAAALSGLTSIAMAAPAKKPTNRPANVPASYIATPFGYMAKHCITQLKPGEVVSGKSIRSTKPSLTTPVRTCDSPRYDSRGAVLGGRVIPAEQDLIARVQIPNDQGISSVSAQFASALPAPLADTGQSVYFFSSLYSRDPANPSELMPVIGWNMLEDGPGWGVASMVMTEGGQLYTSGVQRSSPNDYDRPLLNIYADNGAPRPGQGPFRVQASYGTSTNLLVEGKTQPTSLTQIDMVDALVMATYGVEECNELPDIQNIMVKFSVDQSPLQNLTDSTQIVKGARDLCNMKMTRGKDIGAYGTLNITYDKGAPVATGRSAVITYATK